MNKLQTTTTAGWGGIILAINKVFALFGGHTMNEFATAWNNVVISDFCTACATVLLSVVAILYNEDKAVTKK